MPLTTNQMHGKIAITAIYFGFAVAFAIKGYELISKYILYAHYFDNQLLQYAQYFAGLAIYAYLNGIFFMWFAVSFGQEDDDVSVQSLQSAMYSRQIETGYMKEVGTQTNSDMLVTVLQAKRNLTNSNSSNSRKVINQGPELPIWCGLKTRTTSSTPALHFNSFNFDSTGITMSCAKFQVSPDKCQTTFKDIGGLDAAKKTCLQRIVEPFAQGRGQRAPKSFETPRGVLLIGESGTGKTSLIHSTFNEIRERLPGQEVRLYKVDGAHCFGSFIGSGATFREIFHYAQEQSPLSLLVFKNIDLLHDRSVAILVSELSSIQRGKMLLLATTSQRQKLHQRLRSLHEFDLELELQLPTYWERVTILKLHFKRRNCSVKEKYMTELAHLTETYSGGELEKLVSLVDTKVVENYNQAYFDIIKSIAKPRWSRSQTQQQEGDVPDADDVDYATTGPGGHLKLKEVTKQQLLSAHGAFEKRRLKRKPFTPGNDTNSSTVSSIM